MNLSERRDVFRRRRLPRGLLSVSLHRPAGLLELRGEPPVGGLVFGRNPDAGLPHGVDQRPGLVETLPGREYLSRFEIEVGSIREAADGLAMGPS